MEKRIEQLSGGEKSRLVLATLLSQLLNFLILDEHTNHLDIQSREVLLDILKGFAGTLVLVSAMTGIFCATWWAGFLKSIMEI